MYIVSTAHIGKRVCEFPGLPSLICVVLGLHRLLTAFVYRLEPPALYFMDFRRWETVAHSSMLCIMTWLGDMLVVSISRINNLGWKWEFITHQIYRCWIVWHYNFLVILLPLILLIFEFGKLLLSCLYTSYPPSFKSWISCSSFGLRTLGWQVSIPSCLGWRPSTRWYSPKILSQPV